jgi:hypothetical protein
VGQWSIAVALLGITLASSGSGALEASDPLAVELARWGALVRDTLAEGEIWTEVKEGAGPALARSEQALHEGRRLLALHRLAAVQADLGAALFLLGRPAEERQQAAAFEREWQRVGIELGAATLASSAAAFEAIRPAAVRAIGEAALPQVGAYYDASLDYGRNTQPESGLFYIGAALAQRQFADFCRTLSIPMSLVPPPLRGLGAELDTLEGELVGAYRPPASIDRHPAFILASAAIKQARELDAAGLRYGALYRYLDAVQRVAQARAVATSPDLHAVASRLQDWQERLGEGAVDHSLGRLFLEVAQANLDGAVGSDPMVAAAIAADVLARYFVALEPAAPQPFAPQADVTVTLVRWPYT